MNRDSTFFVSFFLHPSRFEAFRSFFFHSPTLGYLFDVNIKEIRRSRRVREEILIFIFLDLSKWKWWKFINGPEALCRCYMLYCWQIFPDGFFIKTNCDFHEAFSDPFFIHGRYYLVHTEIYRIMDSII